MSKRRKALHGVMEQLDQEVADGHVNEGAHLRLCKRLKRAFDAAPNKLKHIKSYLLEVMTDDPIAAISVPLKYRHCILESPEFLSSLLDLKRKESGSTADDIAPIPAHWWGDLLTGVAPDWIFMQLHDRDFLLLARGIVGILLATDDEALPHVEAHLDGLGVKPSALFALAVPEGGTEGVDPEVTHVLEADARFVRWLLKDETYTEDEQKQLREHAFDFSDPDVHRDASWLKAMGLRDTMDVMACVVSRALGRTFHEARERAIAQPRRAAAGSRSNALPGP